MIAKISSSANLEKVLGYNFKKVHHKEASIILVNNMYQNIQEEYSLNKVLKDMEHSIPDKCRTKNRVFHCSLNPHPEEKLSDETLQQIAKDYMQELGYGNQPFIVFKHNDIEREHIHIVSLRVDSNGQKINDKFEKRRSKKITESLEEKYKLIPSTKTLSKPIEKAERMDIDKGNIKSQTADILNAVFQHYAFRSVGELNAVLSKYNIMAQEVKTEYRGKKYDGIVYIPTNEKGEEIAIPINAKDLGRGYGYTALKNKMEKAKEVIKPHIPSIRMRIIKAMQSSPKTIQELNNNLEKVGLNAFIRTNENGRIYGITFIDDKLGIAINGSRLGKGYSANLFNSYFADPSNNMFLDKELYPTIQKDKQDTQRHNTNIKETEYDSLYEEVVDDLFNEPIFQPINEDWKEKAWQKKLRNKHKIKLKRKK